MSADIEIIKNIPDDKPIRVFLPIKGSKQLFRSQCVYRKSTPPEVTLLFKPGFLPDEDIDLSRPCIMNIDQGGPTVSLEAEIQEVANPQTLHISVNKSINHEQMREFFRVDATSKIITKSFHTELFGSKDKPWSIEGTTIDISGSGILASFPEEPPADIQIRLEITIPSDEPETISVLAHQVRASQLAEDRFEVAYHFDEIATEDRDKIIGCCLVIQRRLLQLKVQVRDQF